MNKLLTIIGIICILLISGCGIEDKKASDVEGKEEKSVSNKIVTDLYSIELIKLDYGFCKRSSNTYPSCLIIDFEFSHLGDKKSYIIISDANIITENGYQEEALNAYFMNISKCEEGVYDFGSLYLKAKKTFSYCFSKKTQEQKPIFYLTLKSEGREYIEKFDLTPYLKE